jgi:lipoprotein NlpD
LRLLGIIILLSFIHILITGCATSAQPHVDPYDLTQPKNSSTKVVSKRKTSNKLYSQKAVSSDYYIVKKKDTVWKISFAYGLDYRLFEIINDLSGNYKIYPGQKLLINPRLSKYKLYHVKSGDTAWRIAKCFGVDKNYLQKLNNIKDITKITEGDLLKVGYVKSSDKVFYTELCSVDGVVATTTATQNQKYYKVKRGDTGLKISKSFGMSLSELQKMNKSKNLNKLEIGDVLKVGNIQTVTNNKNTQKNSTPQLTTKNNKKQSQVKTKTITKTKTQKSKKDNVAKISAKKKITWLWPNKGQVIEKFSTTEHGNKGIDIKGKEGAEIKSAADGKVVYAGNSLRGYGNLIIITHNEEYLSAYAHNKEIKVKEGATVKAGQLIAYMGQTDANRVKLHFEIRYRGEPVNPLKYLPSR